MKLNLFSGGLLLLLGLFGGSSFGQNCAFFAYPDTIVCSSEPNYPVDSLVTVGGTYSAGPGLDINPASGTISPVQSQAGTYAITYVVQDSTCNDSFTTSLTIVPALSPFFQYSGGQTIFCTSEDLVVVDSTVFLPGGIFIVSPNLGLNIAADGSFQPSQSTPGTYSITYDLSNGPCQASFSQFVEIIDAGQTTMDYAEEFYCQTDTYPTPSLMTDTAGFFFASMVPGGGVGLVFADTMGTIRLDQSIPGVYEITFTTDGICPIEVRDTIEIIENQLFLDYAQSTYCQSDPYPTPTLFAPNSPGSFSGVVIGGAGGVVFDDTLGTIRLDQMAPGTYEVIYFLDGVCANEVRDTIEILASPLPQIQINAAQNLLTVTGTGPNASITWFFDNLGGSALDTIPGPTVITNNGSGIYIVEVVGPNGCVGRDTTDFIVNRTEPNLLAQSIRLFPQPAQDQVQLQLDLPHNRPVDLQIVDALGRILWEQDGLRSRQITLELDDMPTGMHWLRFQEGTETATLPLVITR